MYWDSCVGHAPSLSSPSLPVSTSSSLCSPPPSALPLPLLSPSLFSPSLYLSTPSELPPSRPPPQDPRGRSLQRPGPKPHICMVVRKDQINRPQRRRISPSLPLPLLCFPLPLPSSRPSCNPAHSPVFPHSPTRSHTTSHTPSLSPTKHPTTLKSLKFTMNCPCFQVSIPDPNCTAAKKVTVFPVEFVVRGYITGSTDTSLWTHYKNGETHDLFHSILLAHLHRTEDQPIHDHHLEISNVKSFAHLPLVHNVCTVDLFIGSRNYCGIDFPDGLVKNQKLAENLVTPTTKAEHGIPQPPTSNFQTLNPKP